VIIPTYNRQEMLREALRSVLSQTYQDFEIIVVNDGGEDVSEIIDSLNAEGTIVYLRHEENRGVAAARNTALRAASGRYIAYLDDDDVYYPIHLETLVRVLDEGHYKVAYTDSYEILQTRITDRYVTIGERIAYSCDFDQQRMLVSNYITTLNIAHAFDILEEIGLFDEELESHEDWDLWIRLSRKYDFHHIRQVTAAFTKRVDNTSKTSSDRQAFLNTLRMLHSRYSHLLTDPQLIEAQKKVDWSLAMEVEAAKTAIIIADYERQHRYGFAKDFVRNKRVLDLACGEGYGSFLVSEQAASVVGIDSDGANINRARSRYVKENLEFIEGPLTEIPIEAEKLFDVIICFNVIGRIKESNEVLKEIKRLLKPDGVSILSTPNRHSFSETASSKKHGVLGGLYIDEFNALLAENFKNVILWGQKVYSSSNIFPMHTCSVPTKELVIEKGDNGFLFSSSDRKEALFFLAVASDNAIESVTGNSYLLDISETLARHWETYTTNIEATVSKNDLHIANLEARVSEKDGHITNLQEHLKNKDTHTEQLEQIIRTKEGVLQEQAAQLEAKEGVIREQATQLEAKEGVIREQATQIEAKDDVIQEQTQEILNKNTHIHIIESELNLIKQSKVWRISEVFRRLFYLKLLGKFPLLQKAVLTISREGFKAFHIKAKRKLRDVYQSKKRSSPKIHIQALEPYEAYIENNKIYPHVRRLLTDASTQFEYRPLISIIMPVYNVEPRWLKTAVDSVIEQIYTNWELCIADDASTNKETRKLLKSYENHDRIKIVFRERNGHICAASNSAADLAKGEFVAFMDNDDVLATNALFEIVRILQDDPDTDLIYSDEDKIDENNRRYDPQFKPDWSPELFLSYNYVNHFTCIRRKLFESVGQFRKGYEWAQD
jgi:glycosyltransferase involved in cell wall biosynthesis